MNQSPSPFPAAERSTLRGHLPFLDAFRGLAILMVLACHSAAESHSYFSFDGWMFKFQESLSTFLLLPAAMGSLGVAIFFVLSGFCIHLSHARTSDKSFFHFFIRRFFRLYPAYLATLLYLAFFFHWRILWFVRPDFIPQLASHLLLVHNYFREYYYGFNGAFWSLAVEAQLYLLYPLLLLLAERHGWRKAVAVTAFIEISLRFIAALCGLIVPNDIVPRWLTDSPFTYWFCWSMGAALAEAYLTGKPFPHPKIPFWIYITLIFVSYCFKPLQPFYFLLGALVTAQLIAHCLEQDASSAPAPLTGKLGWLLQRIGLFSYSLYLIHSPLLFALSRVISHATDRSHGHLSSVLIFAILMLACLPIMALSYVFYRLIEVPSMALGKKVITRLRA